MVKSDQTAHAAVLASKDIEKEKEETERDT
jgi:hypothetical protein